MHLPSLRLTARNPKFCFRTTLPVILALLLSAPYASNAAESAATPSSDNQFAASITGQISNAATRSYLPGADVELVGAGRSTVTDGEGRYAFNNTPSGNYTLRVSYAGLDTVQLEVIVKAGQQTIRDVELTSVIYKLETVTVAGVREGAAQAIQLQRQAINAKTVAATDTFGNPAGNPGELIQRLPGITTESSGSQIRTLYIRGLGPGFSSLLIDGDRVATSTGSSASRDYQIEQLGTGNIGRVELIKAPTLDQDANAVAGYVNLQSRRAFDLPGRRITMSAGTEWRERSFDGSPFQDRADNVDVLTFSYSDVFSVLDGKKNLGIAFNLNRRIYAATSDEVGPAGVLYTALSQSYLNPSSANPLERIFGVGDFAFDAAAHNAGLSVDYKISPDAYAYTRFTYNTNSQYQVYFRSAFGNPSATAANFTPDSTYDHSILLPHAASTGIVEASNFTKKSKSFGVNAGTEFKLFQRSATVSLRASYSYADIVYPGWYRTQAQVKDIGFEIDRRGKDDWYPIFKQTAGSDITNPASYLMTSLLRRFYSAPNDLYGLRGDFSKDFAPDFPLSLKTGIKYNRDERRQIQDYEESTAVGADGLPGTADDALTPYATVRYKQGTGRYGPIPYMTIPGSNAPGDPLAVPAGYWRSTAANIYNSYASSNSGDAKFRETISAAYIQGTLKLGKVKALAGVRMEQTETLGQAWVRNTTASHGGNSVGGASLDPAIVSANLARAKRSFVRINTGEGKYRDIFPGGHLIYEPFEGLLFRASYNRAISRPSVAFLLPTVTENAETQTITIGNPDLKPYHTDNFEIGVEKYFEPVGLLSASVFLKNISDYTRTISETLGAGGLDGSGLYANYVRSQVRNIGDAKVRGIEINYQQQFSFLPGALKGLGVYANFTYLQTEGNFGTTVTSTKLSNLAPRSGNGGINFRYRGLDARLLANWTDQKYKSTNVVDIFAAPRLSFDVKVQYSITPVYDIYLDVVNLTDEPSRTDITKNDIRFYRVAEGVGFNAGVRARF